MAPKKKQGQLQKQKPRRMDLRRPVFVLCMARSGSTLLRFFLDEHPVLACPPETNIPALCGMMATVWALIVGAPLSANRDATQPPHLPDEAVAGVRRMMDMLLAYYLKKRRKQRYCDKSLGTAQYTYMLNRIWPEARFVIIVRHPMDVIASGLEAQPFGFNSYGFAPFIAASPGNTLHGMACFWLDHVQRMLAALQQYPDHCLLVRYEDLVADPQGTADRIYGFLGLDPVPGIAEKIFSAERERFGPADSKIWNTGKVHEDSVGRGWALPAHLIGAQIRAAIIQICKTLGYLPPDDDWGLGDQPADMRVSAYPPPAGESDESEDSDGDADQPAAEADASASEADAPANGVAAAAPAPLVPGPGFAGGLAERLEAGLALTNGDFSRRWSVCAEDAFDVVATDAEGRGVRWQFHPAARTVTLLSAAEEDAMWTVAAPAGIWAQILDGRLNLSVALQSYRLRYTDADGAGEVLTQARSGMLANVLGLATWGQAQSGAARNGANGAAGPGANGTAGPGAARGDANGAAAADPE